MHQQCTNLVDEMAKQIDEREREQGEQDGPTEGEEKGPGPYRWDAKQGKLVPMSDPDPDAAIFADLDEHESADAVAAQALALAQTSKKNFQRVGHDDLWLCMTVYQLGVAASQKALANIQHQFEVLLEGELGQSGRSVGGDMRGLLAQLLSLLTARERLLRETVSDVASKQRESWSRMPAVLGGKTLY
jgi:hypothetical protein